MLEIIELHLHTFDASYTITILKFLFTLPVCVLEWKFCRTELGFSG